MRSCTSREYVCCKPCRKISEEKESKMMKQGTTEEAFEEEEEEAGMGEEMNESRVEWIVEMSMDEGDASRNKIEEDAAANFCL